MAQSALEKAANKAARRVRDRAYRARRQEYYRALHAAEQSPAVLAAEARAKELDERLESAIARRDAAQNALREQIKALEAQVERLRDSPEVYEAHQARSQAWAEVNALKGLAREAVEKAFPDMQGGAAWSAAAWELPPAVRDELEAARRGVLDRRPADNRSSSAEGSIG
jgi:phage shock protein A